MKHTRSNTPQLKGDQIIENLKLKFKISLSLPNNLFRFHFSDLYTATEVHRLILKFIENNRLDSTNFRIEMGGPSIIVTRSIMNAFVYEEKSISSDIAEIAVSNEELILQGSINSNNNLAEINKILTKKINGQVVSIEELRRKKEDLETENKYLKKFIAKLEGICAQNSPKASSQLLHLLSEYRSELMKVRVNQETLVSLLEETIMSAETDEFDVVSENESEYERNTSALSSDCDSSREEELLEHFFKNCSSPQASVKNKKRKSRDLSEPDTNPHSAREKGPFTRKINLERLYQEDLEKRPERL